MIDEAFLPFAEIIEKLAALPAPFADEEAGVCMQVEALEVESPVELDIVREEDGTLHVGSVPPLYHVDTGIRPVFHRLRLTAVKSHG